MGQLLATPRPWHRVGPIDATDGGYFRASFPPAASDASPSCDDDWMPTVFPEKPGEVLADGAVASINILNGDEERVLLSCILLNRVPTDRERQRRIDLGAHLVTFTLEAVGPIQVEQHHIRMWPGDGVLHVTPW